MSTGAIVALLVGIALLILPAWLAWYLVHRKRRVASWPRAQATIRNAETKAYRSSFIESSTTETYVHAHYEYRDAAGIQHVGEVEHLHDGKVGDIIEIMYDPADPDSSYNVHGGSVGGPIRRDRVFFFTALERFLPCHKRDTSSDDPPQPALVGPRERVSRHLIVAAVCIHSAKHDVVLEHDVAVEAAEVDRQRPAARRHAGQADDAEGGVVGHRRGADPVLRLAGLLHDIGKLEIEMAEKELQDLGITAVPLFIIDDKLAITGAQPGQEFTRAFDETALVSEGNAQ
jgi:hypothetical protein